MALTTEPFRFPGIGRGTRLAVAVGASALLIAACSSSPSPSSSSSSNIASVPIGVVNALTGTDASSGLDTMRGAELAVQIINGAYPDIPLPFAATAGLPGLGGAKIKLYTMDSQSSPQTGAAAVSQLVSSDHVAAIEGGYASADTQTESAEADRFGVAFVNGASSAGALTQRGLAGFFHVGPIDLNFGQQMFAFLKQEAATGHPVSKIAILHTNDPYGDGVEQVTKTLAAQAGYTVVADVAYDAKSTTDLTPEVEKIRAANPDVLFDSSYTADATLLMQTLNRLSYDPGMILAYGAGFSDPTFLPTLKSLAEGIMSRAAWSTEITNKASQLVAAMFQKEYGRPMTENSARSFTAMMTLATAINNAASATPSKITSALESVNIPAKDLIVPWKGVQFNSSHQNIDATGIVQQVQGDKYDVVYPSQYAVAKPIWPLSVALTRSF